MSEYRSGSEKVGSDEKIEGKTTTMSDGKPDGGCLAWTIVVASFMVSFLQDGFRSFWVDNLTQSVVVILWTCCFPFC